MEVCVEKMWVASGLSFLCHVEKSRKRSKDESDLGEENDVAGASFFAFDRPLKAAGRLFGAAPATRDFDVLKAGSSTSLPMLRYLPCVKMHGAQIART